MTTIGPDPGHPDLLALLRLLRLGGLAGGEPAGAAPGRTGPAAPTPPGAPTAPGVPTVPGGPTVPGAPTAPAGPGVPAVPAGPVRPGAPGRVLPPLPAVPVDGPRPGDNVALRDLQRLLVTSLTQAGPVDEVVARVHESLLRVRPELVDLLLPGEPTAQRAQLGQGLAWLLDNLDRPAAMAAGCAQLGAVLRELNAPPAQLQLLGPALAEAMRAALGPTWRTEYGVGWRSAWRLAERWITEGADAPGYDPAFWTATVVSHELRMSDLAVLRLRTYLPYPFRAGQYTTVESPLVPGVWRSYSIAGAPAPDHVLELQVRARSDLGVSGALVYRTGAGDRVRVRVARGGMTLDPLSRRDLLLIAGDTGVAPFKALLGELAGSADDRSAVLFWGVRSLADLYDLPALDALAAACRRATVVPVVSDGDPGPYAGGLVTDAVAAYGQWSQHEAYVAGPPAMVAATSAVLVQLGVPAERIRHDAP